MNQKERNILKLEESFRDTIENDILKQQTENKKIKIKDIKLVGSAEWNDKINGQKRADVVLIVEKEITEKDENGKERTTEQKNYYLGIKCIAGTLGNNQIIYNNTFAISEPDKMKAINELLEATPEEEIEKNSMNKLQTKEMAEILSAHLGRTVAEEEVQKLMEDMDKQEIEELSEEQEEQEEKEPEEKKNKLNKKQTEKIKVNGIQKVDLNKKVDGKQTLGNRLDLKGYESMYVVYSENVEEITPGTKKNNTTYSLIGVKSDGTATVLNDEFEMDKSVGNGATRNQTKVRADSTATRDNKDVSVYTRKSNGMSIGCENDMGNVNMFLYQKTKEENENVGIQIETSKTQVIPVETREIMNKNRGTYQGDKVQDEIQEHTDEGCKPKDVKDFDGDENTVTHEHFDLEYYVQEILNYENDQGEEQIKEVFTANEVREKLLRELKEKENQLSQDQIIQGVKEEMNLDAENLEREHKR